MASVSSDPHAEGAHVLEALTFSPAEGAIPPYSSQPISIRFAPVAPKVGLLAACTERGFDKGLCSKVLLDQCGFLGC